MLGMPQIKIDGELVGGYNQLVEYFEKQGKVNFKGEIISEIKIKDKGVTIIPFLKNRIVEKSTMPQKDLKL